MAAKVITISLPEALEWKLSELNRQTGIPKSALISRALLLLVSDFNVIVVSGGAELGKHYTLEDIEKEYQGGDNNGKTAEANS
jgi:hypothetical protein